MNIPFEFILESRDVMQRKGFGQHLNETDYSNNFVYTLNKTGSALTDYLTYVNWGIDIAVNNSDFNLPYNQLLQADVAMMATVLTVLSLFPRHGIIYSFLDSECQCSARRRLAFNATDERFL